MHELDWQHKRRKVSTFRSNWDSGTNKVLFQWFVTLGGKIIDLKIEDQEWSEEFPVSTEDNMVDVRDDPFITFAASNWEGESLS